MSDIPADLHYTSSHEWIRQEDDGDLYVGISDHAQAQLGDLVYVELPEIGSTLSAGDSCAVVESVKAASDVYAPVSGEVTAVNEDLAEAPELVNNDPFGDGWLFALRPSDSDEIDELMNADAYEASLEED